MHGPSRSSLLARGFVRTEMEMEEEATAFLANGGGGSKGAWQRAVLKSGFCNLYPIGIPTRFQWRFLQDTVTTMVDMRWRYALLICALSFFISWTLFAVLWWLIAWAHGDLEEHHLPTGENLQNKNGWRPCVTDIYNFTSCFLFSMENQHTTGFGARMPTEECPEAIFLMCMQGIVGVVLQSITVGLVFLKLVRPKQRTRTLEFSKNAVICRRDGHLCFIFRVGDLRRSHIIEAKLRVLFVRSRITPEGEVLSPSRTELKIEDTWDSKSNFFCLLWPETVVHSIDYNSPLYHLSARDLEHAQFEIIPILEGTIESTDQRIQARTSYLPREILWGHRFVPIVSYNTSQLHYNMDYSKFHETYPVETSDECAQVQEELYKT